MARPKNDTTAADTADSQAGQPADASPEAQGLFAEIQAAVKSAAGAGDHAAHGALSAIETCFVDLRTRMASIEEGVSDDVRAVIAKIKAVL